MKPSRLALLSLLLLPLLSCTLLDRFLPSATTQPTSTPLPAAKTNIFLIALEDGGATGMLVGCGDSLIPVPYGEWYPTVTFRQIAYALTDFLALHDQFYGESGLYNALYQSDLTVQNVNIDASGFATVDLSGQLVLGGVCDGPRVKAQLEQTILQFGVTGVTVTINGTPLDNLISGQ